MAQTIYAANGDAVKRVIVLFDRADVEHHQRVLGRQWQELADDPDVNVFVNGVPAPSGGVRTRLRML